MINREHLTKLYELYTINGTSDAWFIFHATVVNSLYYRSNEQ
jgi:hypothetical protein